jgi:cytidyltransferase-like protein
LSYSALEGILAKALLRVVHFLHRRSAERPSVTAMKKPAPKKKQSLVVAVSGGFDPIHIGHVRMMKEAKKLAGPKGKLVVILNNDHWLRQKKNFVFMPEAERKEIIEHLTCVDEVMLSFHKKNAKDMSVCAELRTLRPDLFVNGGDRTKENIPELALEKEFNMKMVFGIGKGGKVQSSSWLVSKVKGKK